MADQDRDYLESIAKLLVHCEGFGLEFATNWFVVERRNLHGIEHSMLSLRAQLHAWLRSHPRPPADSDGDYWSAFCSTCGWAGLSRDCEGGEPIADTGDFEEVLCPVCRTVVVDDKRTA